MLGDESSGRYGELLSLASDKKRTNLAGKQMSHFVAIKFYYGVAGRTL